MKPNFQKFSRKVEEFKKLKEEIKQYLKKDYLLLLCDRGGRLVLLTNYYDKSDRVEVSNISINKDEVLATPGKRTKELSKFQFGWYLVGKYERIEEIREDNQLTDIINRITLLG